MSIDISSIASLNTSTPTASTDNFNDILKRYPDLFTGIGKIKDFQVELHIDPHVPPVTQPHRLIPFHLRKKLDAELGKLERQGIIEPVDGPTPWVSPLVVTSKQKNPHQIRVCVDMRQPNRAILRERHITPTVNNLIHDLNGATVFSKIDLKSGYHQLELTPDSRYIPTILLITDFVVTLALILARHQPRKFSRTPSNKFSVALKVYATSVMILSFLGAIRKPTTAHFTPFSHVYKPKT